MVMKVRFEFSAIEKLDIKDVLLEYSGSTGDIFEECSNLVYQLRRVIYTELSESDRRIILLYAELGSQRKVGKVLGCSASTVNQKIKQLRELIISRLNLGSVEGGGLC